MTSIATIAANETYAEVQLLLYDLVHKFIKRHGGDFDELVSRANELYMDAYISYDPDKGSFSKRVQYVVWNGMLDSYRVSTNRTRLLKRQPEEILKSCFLPEQEKFDLWGLLQELSGDGRTAVVLALRSPPEMMEAMVGNDTPTSLAKALKSYLQTVGWAPSRIARVFREVRQALR